MSVRPPLCPKCLKPLAVPAEGSSRWGFSSQRNEIWIQLQCGGCGNRVSFAVGLPEDLAVKYVGRDKPHSRRSKTSSKRAEPLMARLSCCSTAKRSTQ